MFPASTRLEEALTEHATTYVRTRSKLAPFLQLVRDKINGLEFKRFAFPRRVNAPCPLKTLAYLVSSSDVIAFGFNHRGTDETWCIDTRGVLTMSIDPGTYQRLGLLGTPLPWRPHKDRYSKRVPFAYPRKRTRVTFWVGSRCAFAEGSEW